MSAVVYPGTFDPITYGHVDLIQRAAKLFDQVIVAVAEHTTKKTLFNIEERVLCATEALSDLPAVTVQGFQGLLVDFVRQQNIPIILRGVRAIADFEYERQLAGINNSLAPEVETIFMAPAEKYTHISSTFVRDVIRLGGDVTSFVPLSVIKRLKKYGLNDHR